MKEPESATSYTRQSNALLGNHFICLSVSVHNQLIQFSMLCESLECSTYNQIILLIWRRKWCEKGSITIKSSRRSENLDLVNDGFSRWCGCLQLPVPWLCSCTNSSLLPRDIDAWYPIVKLWINMNMGHPSLTSLFRMIPHRMIGAHVKDISKLICLALCHFSILLLRMVLMFRAIRNDNISCYDSNFDHQIAEGCQDGFVYDSSIISSSATMDLGMVCTDDWKKSLAQVYIQVIVYRLLNAAAERWGLMTSHSLLWYFLELVALHVSWHTLRSLLQRLGFCRCLHERYFRVFTCLVCLSEASYLATSVIPWAVEVLFWSPLWF